MIAAISRLDVLIFGVGAFVILLALAALVLISFGFVAGVWQALAVIRRNRADARAGYKIRGLRR